MYKLKLLTKFYGNVWAVGDAEWYLIKPNTRLLKHLRIIYAHFRRACAVFRIQSDGRKLFNSSW